MIHKTKKVRALMFFIVGFMATSFVLGFYFDMILYSRSSDGFFTFLFSFLFGLLSLTFGGAMGEYNQNKTLSID